MPWRGTERTRGFAPTGLSWVVLVSPWQWLTNNVTAFQAWITSDTTRAAAGNAALLLMVGGLCNLLLIVSLFLLQSVFPVQPSPLAAAKGKRQLRPRRGLPALRVRADRKATRSRSWSEPPINGTPRVDGALEEVALAGVGEPRILRDLPHQLELRLLDCSGCRTFAPAGSGCVYEEGFLFDALKTVYPGTLRIRETTCRRKGHAFCEFEARH